MPCCVNVCTRIQLKSQYLLKIPLKLEVGKYKQSTHACDTTLVLIATYYVQIKPRNNIAEKKLLQVLQQLLTYILTGK